MLGNADTTGFSRVVFQFNLESNNSRFLDTTDFSRVEFQFQPDFAPSKKAETEHSTRLKSVVSKKITRRQL